MAGSRLEVKALAQLLRARVSGRGYGAIGLLSPFHPEVDGDGEQELAVSGRPASNVGRS